MIGETHLSFYALDRLRLGEPASDEERIHLGICPRCAEVVAPVPVDEPLPDWLATARLAAPRDGRVGRAPRRWRALWPIWTMGTALALVAGLFVLIPRLRTEDSALGIREKGSPALRIFVRRGERVFVWTGQRVQPDDRLRVEVNGQGFGFVSIAGLGTDPSHPTLLHEGKVASGAQLLPLSFRVDAQGKQEVLSVIFGRIPVALDLHAQESANGGAQGKDGEKPRSGSALEAKPESTWRQIVVIDKEIP